MDAMEFVKRYEDYLDEIRLVIRPELYPQLHELAQTDPHDLVSPGTWFPTDTAVRGFVWSIFVNRVKKIQQNER